APSASVAQIVVDASVAPPPPPPAPSECETLEASNRALFAGAVDGCPLVMPTLSCGNVGGATWALRFRSVRGSCETALYEVVAHRSGDGGTLEQDAGTILHGDADNELAIQPLADYDGDGNEEVLVEQRTKASDEEPRVTTWRVLTARAASIEPYVPAAKVAIA